MPLEDDVSAVGSSAQVGSCMVDCRRSLSLYKEIAVNNRCSDDENCCNGPSRKLVAMTTSEEHAF